MIIHRPTPQIQTKLFMGSYNTQGLVKSVIVMSADEQIHQICGGLDMLTEDTSIPRNIRRGSDKVKQMLLNNTDPVDLRVASAISTLDELANDPNIPLHGRTLIWNIMSQLEGITL